MTTDASAGLTNHGCVIVMESLHGKSHCTTCGRQWEACTPQGSDNHCIRELGSLLADLRGKLEGECNESAMLRRELEAERAKVREREALLTRAVHDIDDKWCREACALLGLPASVDAKGEDHD
jgi:hypothetical protein